MQSVADRVALSGTEVGTIPVVISNHLVDVFFGQPYGSPSKAIEELVANSLDAFASTCIVSVPEQAAYDDVVWVWDDGESMDIGGLQTLWLVAQSYKRKQAQELQSKRKGRLPIGKFGIGKLASYAVGKRMTHLCKKNGEYLAVTMDYARIIARPSSEEHKPMYLSVRKLTREQVAKSFPYVFDHDHNGKTLAELDKSLPSWTAVVVDHLKQPLPIGRLRWVLSTGSPLRPDFDLWFNGEEIGSSESKIPIVKKWTVGKLNDDKAAKKLGYLTINEVAKKSPYDYAVDIPDYGTVSGTVELYESSLNAGKSDDLGSSSGFFIKVRGRLINTTDLMFGISAIPQGHVMDKFRAVIYADYLDAYLKADRVDLDSNARAALAVYLQAVFNEVRAEWEKYVVGQAKVSVEGHPKEIPGPPADIPLHRTL